MRGERSFGGSGESDFGGSSLVHDATESCRRSVGAQLAQDEIQTAGESQELAVRSQAGVNDVVHPGEL